MTTVLVLNLVLAAGVLAAIVGGFLREIMLPAGKAAKEN